MTVDELRSLIEDLPENMQIECQWTSTKEMFEVKAKLVYNPDTKQFYILISN